MKKVLSIVLSLVMLLSVSIGGNITAFALNKTADEAINWCKSKVGTYLGGQCVN